MGDTKELAKMLEDAGCCAICVSSDGRKYHFSTMTEPQGIDVPLVEAIKKVVKIPVIAVGRVTPGVAERALRDNKADLVAIGRALLADPELPNKAALGRLDDILPCLACDACKGAYSPQRCTVNASLGKEREYRIVPAKKVKKVVVIGGGPAGLEAARVAALRGHKVILYEKAGKLGGRLRLSSKMPGYGSIEELIKYLSHQVTNAGVNIHLKEKATAALMDEVKPDAVILATGSRLSLPSWLVAGAISILAWRKLKHTGGRSSRSRPVRISGARKDEIGIHSVFLTAAEPNQALSTELSSKVPEVYRIGDCMLPFGMMEAIADGAHVGRIV